MLFVFLLVSLLILLPVAISLVRRDDTVGPQFGPYPGGGHDAVHCCGHPHHRQQGPVGAGNGPDDEALRTLNNRLAAGDIDPADYRERVRALRETRAQNADPTAGMPYLGPEDEPGPAGPRP